MIPLLATVFYHNRERNCKEEPTLGKMKPKCYTFSMKDIIWSPSEEMIAQSNVRRFMRKHRLSSYDALIAWSVADIGRFWDAVMKDLAIEWETPYHRVYDSSAGVPWTRWFVGGTTNITANCVDRHVRTHPNAAALIWEGEDRSTRTLTYAELDREIRRL